MKRLKNEEGVALITVLLFSMVAFGVVTGAYYMVTSHSKLSGMSKRYISEIEVARGVASYVIGELKNGTLQCNNGNTCCSTPPCTGGLTGTPATCQSGKTIDIHGAICAALGKTASSNGCNNVTACMMSRTDYTEIDPARAAPNDGVKVSVYSINVKSNKPSGETADIDVVVRL